MGKVKFAIIGTSNITESFLDAAKKHDDFILNCVYSRDIKKAQEFAKKYGAEFVFDDLNLMAKSDKFDAIYIASPNAFHGKQSIQFLNAGKHVLCEKAFALNEEEALRMVETARKNNVLLTEAMRSTSAKGFIALKNNLHKIGTIRRYLASFCQYSSRYDAYKTGKDVPNIFRKEMGAGSLMDIGVYCIAPMVNLFGIPKNIMASATMLESGVDGQGSVICNYANFDAISMHSKIANSHCGIEIQGEKGTIIVDNIRYANVKIIYKDGTKYILHTQEIENDMFYEIDDFIKTINNGKLESDLNTLKNSVEVIKVLDKIRACIGLEFN